jgi:non-ribosomal peptide synthetase component E (peptide arylation enzyme)
MHLKHMRVPWFHAPFLDPTLVSAADNEMFQASLTIPAVVSEKVTIIAVIPSLIRLWFFALPTLYKDLHIKVFSS